MTLGTRLASLALPSAFAALFLLLGCSDDPAPIQPGTPSGQVANTGGLQGNPQGQPIAANATTNQGVPAAGYPAPQPLPPLASELANIVSRPAAVTVAFQLGRLSEIQQSLRPLLSGVDRELDQALNLPVAQLPTLMGEAGGLVTTIMQNIDQNRSIVLRIGVEASPVHAPEGLRHAHFVAIPSNNVAALDSAIANVLNAACVAQGTGHQCDEVLVSRFSLTSWLVLSIGANTPLPATVADVLGPMRDGRGLIDSVVTQHPLAMHVDGLKLEELITAIQSESWSTVQSMDPAIRGQFMRRSSQDASSP